MGLLRSIFGPSKEEIWHQISQEIKGEYIDGGFWGRDVLLYRHGEWEILLDTYTVKSGSGSSSSSQTYTRMRAPFINKDNLHFKIYRESIFSPIGKLFGMQDIEIGDSFFDNEYVIKGNDEGKIKELFANERLRRLIESQPGVHFEIRDDEGFFSTSFPDGVDELYFQTSGTLTDKSTLRALFELFALTLEHLVEIDSAYENDPGISLV